jgi:hypothetical protein
MTNCWEKRQRQKARKYTKKKDGEEIEAAKEIDNWGTWCRNTFTYSPSHFPCLLRHGQPEVSPPVCSQASEHIFAQQILFFKSR